MVKETIGEENTNGLKKLFASRVGKRSDKPLEKLFASRVGKRSILKNELEKRMKSMSGVEKRKYLCFLYSKFLTF